MSLLLFLFVLEQVNGIHYSQEIYIQKQNIILVRINAMQSIFQE